MSHPPFAMEPDHHLTAEDLGVLAEGRATEEQMNRATQHLARCRSCMSAYADTVRYRAAWVARPELFEKSVGRKTLQPGVPLRGRLRLRILAGAITAVVAILAVILLPRLGGPGRGESAAIQALLARASSEGLVLPGGESLAATGPSRYRSDSPIEVQAEREVERLRREHETGQGRTEDLYTLAAGLLALGRKDLANDYITEGRGRSPSDHRFAILDGIASYQAGDVGGAEHALREAVASAPGDPVARLDLGLVLASVHGPERAAAYLEEVIAKAPNSPLAMRARRALEVHER